MNKKIIWGALVVLAVAIVAVLVSAPSKKTALKEQPSSTGGKSVAEIVKTLPIKTFSLSGQVTKVVGSEVFFKAPVVVSTDKGNVVQDKEKTATVDSKTVISKTDAKGKVTLLKLSDLKSGTQIVVYTSDNVFEKDQLNASKIDVK